MTSHDWLLPLLSLFRVYPGMYLGDEYVETLHAYLTGYTLGREAAGSPGMSFADGQLLTSFGEWLFQAVPQNGGGGWAEQVARMEPPPTPRGTRPITPTRLFFVLFDQFLVGTNCKSLSAIPPNTAWKIGFPPSPDAEDWLLRVLAVQRKGGGARLVGEHVLTLQSLLVGHRHGREHAGMPGISTNDDGILTGFRQWLLDCNNVQSSSFSWGELIAVIDPTPKSAQTFFLRFEDYLKAVGMPELDTAPSAPAR